MKHIILKATAFLILGAILNVAVAWGCCFQIPRHVKSAVVRDLAREFDHPEESIPWVEFAGHGAIAYGLGITNLHLSYGSGIPYSDFRIDAGFPLRALTGSRTGDSPVFAENPVVIDSLIEPELAILGGVRLPTRPRWFGFAINTIFYAAILWLLFAAPAFLRRRMRLKRGLCPACAYPMGTSETCTECGRCVR